MTVMSFGLRFAKKNRGIAQRCADLKADRGPSNPPGWYSDPFGVTTWRWWDGRDWGHHTHA